MRIRHSLSQNSDSRSPLDDSHDDLLAGTAAGL